MSNLESIASLTDQKQKVEQYRSLLSSLVNASDVEGLKGLIDHSALISLYMAVLKLPGAMPQHHYFFVQSYREWALTGKGWPRSALRCSASGCQPAAAAGLLAGHQPPGAGEQ